MPERTHVSPGHGRIRTSTGVLILTYKPEKSTPD
jgi:hypothetical protein